MDVADSANHRGLCVGAKHVPGIGAVQVKFAIVEKVVPKTLKLQGSDTIPLLPQNRDHLPEGCYPSLSIPGGLSGARDQITYTGKESFAVRKAIDHELAEQLVNVGEGESPLLLKDFTFYVIRRQRRLKLLAVRFGSHDDH